MLQLKRTISTYILVSALFPTLATQAATYYVATNGNDSNNGTSENTPYRTIAKATRGMVAGDTTYVKNGTYIEETISIRKTGTATAPVKLLAYPGHAPIIKFNDPGLSVSGKDRKYLRILIQETPGHNKEIAWITVEGFVIQDGVNGIRWYNCRNCTIRRNHIRNTYGSGILGTGALDTTIDRNIIEGAGSPETGAHGLYLTGSRYTITNNIIYGTEKYAIQLKGIEYPSQLEHYAGPEFAKTENAVIANNVLAYSRIAPGLVIWGAWDNNARIENNIFYQNAQDGGSANGIHWVTCCSTGIQIKNNIFYATPPRSTLWMTTTHVKEGVNFTQSGNLINVDNPEFVDGPETPPASPNFKLTERSPAINKGLTIEQSQTSGQGLPLTTTKIDFGGTTRPQGRGYDIGAYEYSSGNNAQSPNAPTALQVD